VNICQLGKKTEPDRGTSVRHAVTERRGLNCGRKVGLLLPLLLLLLLLLLYFFVCAGFIIDNCAQLLGCFKLT